MYRHISITHFLLLFSLCALLLVIALHDARTGIIPNSANAALALTGLIGSILGIGPSLDHAVIGVAVVLSISILLHFAILYWRHRPAIGMGDVKFLGAAVIWTGLAALPTVILIASVTGLLFLLVRSFAGHAISPETRIAFGPHLAAGLALVSLFGSPS
jgi:leader peptidase (prepilin peptidase)/N-methyltransferase